LERIAQVRTYDLQAPAAAGICRFKMIKLAKYFVIGAVAAAVDFAIFAALVKMAGWPWYLAAATSFVAATMVNYALSIRHVFTSGIRYNKRNEIALTFLVSAIGLGVNQAVMYVLIHQGIAVLAAKIGATGTVFLWNFTARHRFVFRENSEQA
jgi:putative flippase GtrA